MRRLTKMLGGALSPQLVCLVILASAHPGMAQDGGLAGQISQSESLMFGHSTTGMSAQSRVEALESNIFGQPGSGPLNDRLKKINEALGLGKSVKPSSPVGTAAAKSPVKTSSLEAKPSNKSNPKTKAPAKLQAMTAKTDMPLAAPNRKDAALPPVAPKSVMSPKQLLQLGTKRFAEGKDAEAESLFQQVLVHDPKNIDGLFNLGALAERRGDLSAALNYYRSALSLKPADPDLKQAADSVERLIAINGPTSGNAGPNGPFHMPQQLGQPLQGGVFDSQQMAGQSFTGTPMQASMGQVGQQPALAGTVVGQGNVTQPSIGVANVTQPSHGAGNMVVVKQGLRSGLSVGLSHVLPGPLNALHCPLCNLLLH